MAKVGADNASGKSDSQADDGGECFGGKQLRQLRAVK